MTSPDNSLPPTKNNTPQRNRACWRKGLLFGCLLLGGFLALSYRPEVAAVYCSENAAEPRPGIVMLGASWCPYCRQARRYFVNNELEYCEFDIENSATGGAMYRSMNRPAIPVILIGDYRLTGFSKTSIERALTLIESS